MASPYLNKMRLLTVGEKENSYHKLKTGRGRLPAQKAFYYDFTGKIKWSSSHREVQLFSFTTIFIPR